MNFFSFRQFLIALFLILSSGAFAQNIFFNDASEAGFKLSAQKRAIVPLKYRTVSLDTTGILSFFRLTPAGKNISNPAMAPVIAIPMPNGSSARFYVWETPVMAPELARLHPGIRTFTGQGIDDKTATLKIDWSEFGFHAMISSPITGAVFIDPYDFSTVTNYISYYKADFKKAGKFTEIPAKLSAALKNQLSARPAGTQAAICVGTQLRTYRLAVACTHEYAIAATGLTNPTKAQTLAKIVTTVNRVNGVYEKEFSVSLVLVASENNVIFNSAAVDPFTPSTFTGGVSNQDGANYDASILIPEGQQKIDSAIGDANYDIGHTFSTGAGGLSYVGVVCVSGFKASSVTGSTNPVGDPYDIDYVAHEMGHEFNAVHTFNSTLGGCDGNQDPTANVEPGSGSTIMAYAGLCQTDNLQNNSDAMFSAFSFDEMTNYVIAGAGNGCPTVTATGNATPVVNAGANYSIPISTPFVLTGSATDPNVGDVLTYSWEEVDAGGPFGAWNAPTGNAPLFRAFLPVSTPVRYFPKISDVVNNTSTVGEILPSYARTMNFRLTARDNHANGGGVCYAQNTVSTIASAGPFVVTYPTATGVVWNVNDFQTVTWNPAGTALAPIGVANVSIMLSTDGGLTFPITLVASTPNDGSQEIQVPNNVSATARIRVMAIGNIFYDISNNNFTIQTSPTATFAFNHPDPVIVCSAVSSGTDTIKTGALKGFSTAIALSASLNPAGTTVSFGTTSLVPGNSTTVTLNNTNTLAAGTYTVRVTGIAGAVNNTRDILFVVGSGPGTTSGLTYPAADTTGVILQPTFSWAPVVGASSYTLEISQSNTFATIEQSISNINSLPVTLTTALAENTVYYWRVKATNTCGTSAASASRRFKTGYNACRLSTDVPKLISAVGTPTITSTLTVPVSMGAIITDVNVVGLVGTHDYVHDLVFTLISPDSTKVVILSNICDGYADFDLVLDDQASSGGICPPIGGEIQTPSNPLSAFIGKNSSGTWTLVVNDQFNGSGGQLNGWGLLFNSNSTNCTFNTSAIATTYTFTGNGNWNLAANWSNNTIPPSPLPSGSNIVINHAAGGNCILNVNQVIYPGASITVNTGKNLLVKGALKIQ